ncbi:hypothetical protein HDU96_003032, partial [Phlyctochytrium bullatum]
VDDSRSVTSVNSSTASLRAGVTNLGLNSRPAIDPELAPNLLELAQLPSLGYVEKRPKNPPRPRKPGRKPSLNLQPPPATKEAAKEVRAEARAKLAAADSAISPRCDPSELPLVEPKPPSVLAVEPVEDALDVPIALETPPPRSPPPVEYTATSPPGSPITPSDPPPASVPAADAVEA